MSHPLHDEINRKLKKVRFGHVKAELAQKGGATSFMTIIQELDHQPTNLHEAAQIIFDALRELSEASYSDKAEVSVTMKEGRLLKLTVSSKTRIDYAGYKDPI